MGTDQLVFLSILFHASSVHACNGVQEIFLQPYMGKKIAYPEIFPVNTGYESSLNCSWKVTAAQEYEVVVYPKWVCNSDATFSLFYGPSNSAQKDGCVSCPSNNGYCTDIIQTRSSEVLLSLSTSYRSGGGFQFRFMAVEKSRASTCKTSGTRLLAEKTPSFITSPGFPSNYQNNVNCLWIVEPAAIEKDTHLVFEFRSQYLEMGFDGCSDFVRIGALNDFCEQVENNILLASSRIPLNGTTANVCFTSDFGYSSSGFVLAFYVETVGGASQTSEALPVSSHSSSSKATAAVSQDTSTSSVIGTRGTPESTLSPTVDIDIQTSVHLPQTSRAPSSHETNILPRFLLKIIPEDDLSLKYKEDINLRCAVQYPEFLINLIGGSFLWEKDGKEILPDSGYNVTIGKLSTTLSKPSAVPADSGTYSCWHSASLEPMHVSIYVNITKSGGGKEKSKPQWLKDAISKYLKDKIKIKREMEIKLEKEKINLEKRKQKMEMEMFRIEKEESIKLLELLALLIKDQKQQ